MSRNVLVIAPHPDDESIGPGGTIAKHAQAGDRVFVLIVSGHLPPLYERAAYDATVAEATEAMKLLGVADARYLEIPTGMIGSQPQASLNRHLGRAVQELQPEIVLCPFPDRHIDHRLVFESAMVATRPRDAGAKIRLLAAYETVSQTHWNAPQIEPTFSPNFVVDITAQMETKLRAVGCYRSQIPAFPGARSLEAIEALAKFRGTQAGFAFGEAFQVIRLIG